MGDKPKEEWLTPQWILDPLGKFDLDPCSPIKRPWPTANQHYTVLDNGLMKEWHGRVWLNPPYGDEAIRWMQRMSIHCNGIALLVARTDTKIFQDYVFGVADGMFFIRGRIQFCTVDGSISNNNLGAPSVLIAYGQENADILSSCGLRGRFVPLQRSSVAQQHDLFTEVKP